MTLKAGRACSLDSASADESFLQARKSVWFSPEHDVVAWHGRKKSTLVPINDPMGYFYWHASRSQGVLLHPHRVFEWQEDPELPEEFESVVQKRTLFFCLGTVAIHTTASQAFESGLWGITGEEIVQLADPTDTERLRKYASEINLDDHIARDFFEAALNADAGAVHKSNEVREARFKARWVLKHLQAASKTRFRGVPDPDQLFPKLRLPERFRYIGMPSRWVDPDTKYLRLNPDHPWVKSILDQMPSLRPTYMIRFVCWIAILYPQRLSK